LCTGNMQTRALHYIHGVILFILTIDVFASLEENKNNLKLLDLMRLELKNSIDFFEFCSFVYKN
jgi:hypothetical protein